MKHLILHFSYLFVGYKFKFYLSLFFEYKFIFYLIYVY